MHLVGLFERKVGILILLICLNDSGLFNQLRILQLDEGGVQQFISDK